MNEDQQIAKYLADETLLYQDWYKGYQQLTAYDPDVVEVSLGELPSIADIKKYVKDFYVSKQPVIRDILCKKSRYWHFKNKLANQHDLIKHIMAAIITDFAFFSESAYHAPYHTIFVMTLASILVAEHYLDELCAGVAEEG
ncbi:MAG: hypothetical protein BWK78_04985 [Thiotrichaceae bacterium IS1]|nr:MAG: hypothetical protein BWK78_04985 [Thiotrichaceae bacterium IS1]